MWYLVCRGKDGRSYRLKSDKKQYEVSRTVGDITLTGDQSVSRKHAVFTFETDDNGEKIVTIKDLASKYGTYVNNSEKLKPNERRVLSDGDVVTFGCQWNEWRFHSKPLVVISSNMPNESKAQLRQIISELDGIVVADWQESCSHLTMVEILLTAKVVCALASAIPIVTPNYWERFKEAIDEQKMPPNYEEFIPPLKESVLNKNRVSFTINNARKKLFSGKKFIFSTDKQLKKYKTIVVAAGGSCQTLSTCEMTVEELCGPDVVLMQHITNKDPQPSPLYDSALQEIRKKGMKPIPESEIGLAILMCSLDVYCNMKYNVIGNVLEGGVVLSQVKRAEVLAEDSQISVFDSVSVKIEEPAVKTENESEVSASTSVLSVMASSSLSSSRELLNNQETLPCDFKETLSNNVNEAMGGITSPCIASDPSRKRPPSTEIGEPPLKKCIRNRNVEGVKEKCNSILGGVKLNQKEADNVMNDKEGILNGSTSKRKRDELDSDCLSSRPQKKSGKAKPTSEVFPDFSEFLAIPEDEQMSFLMSKLNSRTSKSKLDSTDSSALDATSSSTSKKAKPSSSLFAFKNGPSTSGAGHVSTLELEEEDNNWRKESELALKASGWDKKLKGSDAKEFRNLKDLGMGITVKVARLVVNDRPKQILVESSACDPSVVNYKKFRKVRPVGCQGGSLPVIIGGSDLVPFQGGDKTF